MDAAIVLAPEPTPAAPDRVAETANRLATLVRETVVVCSPGRREAVAAAAESEPRVVADAVPGGGPVAAMRAGFRATGARAALVTTAGTPPLDEGAVSALSPPAGTDAVLAVLDGDSLSPCGGYRVTPATAACDTTLAMGSRQLSDVLARLSVATAEVHPPASASPTDPN